MRQRVGPTLIPFPWQYFKSYQPSFSHPFSPPIATPSSSFIAPFIVKSTLCIFQPSSAIFKNSFFLFKQTPFFYFTPSSMLSSSLTETDTGGNKKLKAGGKLMYLSLAGHNVMLKWSSSVEKERKERRVDCGSSVVLLTDCVTYWLAGRPPDWLNGRLTGWQSNRLAEWLTAWPTVWLAECLTDWLLDWLSYWLADRQQAWLIGWQTESLSK